MINVLLSCVSRLLSLIAFAFIVQGCQQAPPLPSSLPLAEPARYDLTLRKPNETLSEDTQRMLDIFDGFLNTMSKGSPVELGNFLEQDFMLHVVYENATSNSYGISEVSEFQRQADLGLVFFKDIQYIPLQFNVAATGEVLLTLKAKKTSRFFRSEQMVFAKYNHELSKISSIAIRPILPIIYASEPDIYVSRTPNSSNEYANNWKDLVARLNPDGAVEFVKEHEVRGVTRDESPHSVLVIFPEPLPPGTFVSIEHQFYMVRAQRWLRPFRLNYRIDEPGEYQVIETFSRAGGPAKRTIRYRVFVNGQKVAERTVPVI